MKWVCYVLLSHLCVLECPAMSPSEIEEFSNYLQDSSKLDQQVKSYKSEGGDEEGAISDYAWETSGKFEGDLILNERQRKMILSNVVEGLARNGLTDTTTRWPNNELVYFINTEHFYSKQYVSTIKVNMYFFTIAAFPLSIQINFGYPFFNNNPHTYIKLFFYPSNTVYTIRYLWSRWCIVNYRKFRPYQQGDRYAVNIMGNRDGCFSEVGYQGGYQILNLDNRHHANVGCFQPVVVMHELLHALGFYHMQSTPNRDEFVDVLWDNIIKQERHNFLKYNSYAVTDFGIGYDYMSIMHYGRNAFSLNGRDTLVPKNGAYIGQRSWLSEKDIIKLNIMYCHGASNDIEWRRKGTKNKGFIGHGLDYEKSQKV